MAESGNQGFPAYNIRENSSSICEDHSMLTFEPIFQVKDSPSLDTRISKNPINGKVK